MILLTLLVALLLQHLAYQRLLNLPDIWFDGFQRALMGIKGLDQPLMNLVVMLLPAVALGGFLVWVDNPWLSFVLEVVILFYAFGCLKFRGLLETFSGLENKHQISHYLDERAELVRGFPHSFYANLNYLVMTRFFLFTFWFVLMGIPMVLFIHSLQIMRLRYPQIKFNANLIYWLEWPVIKLIEVSYALMGDFAAMMGRILSADIHQTSQAKMKQATATALGAKYDEKRAELWADKSLQLLERCRLLWLGLIAIYLLLV